MPVGVLPVLFDWRVTGGAVLALISGGGKVGSVPGGGMPGLLRDGWRRLEEWWFDASRGVRTAGNASFRHAGDAVGEGGAGDGEIYVPARVRNGRSALADVPVKDRSAYTFVDLGSGKGRMLLVAAEMGFGRCVGVEFSRSLQAQAEENLRRFRGRKGVAIESVLADAAEFAFPAGDLVVYLFNPFGAETMGRVLRNLERSMEEAPRHVAVVLLWPEHGAMVAAMRGMRLVRATRRHQVYEAGWDAAGGR